MKILDDDKIWDIRGGQNVSGAYLVAQAEHRSTLKQVIEELNVLFNQPEGQTIIDGLARIIQEWQEELEEK